ncbi:MAG: hypothetical protein WC141_05125 [Arcobacteraceae bacterium]
MKKLFIGLGIFIVLNISTAYLFLFTPFGNELVSSFVETKINEKEPIGFKFEEFVLSFDTLKIKATIDTTSHIELTGDIDLLSLKFNLKYMVDIKDLSKLEKWTKQKLNGNFKTNGEIKGNKDLLLVNGLTDVFGSNSKYDVVLKNFNVSNIDFLFKQIYIEKLLYTLNQPSYAKGKIDIAGNITNIELENLSGKIATSIYDGQLNNKVVNEKFELKLVSNKNFQGKINTILKPMLIDNAIDFKTSFANLNIKSATLNLKDNAINSDYEVVVENLNHLYDITQMNFLGNLTLNGTVKKTKDLEVTGHSNTLKGTVDFRLFNDDFNAKIKNIEAYELTKMLMYPSFFVSKVNAVLDYNIVSQQGVLTANLLNGQFIKTEFSTLINNLARFDLTKEVYQNVDLTSKINKKVIQSKISMNSDLTSIEVPSSLVDLDAQTTNTQVDLKIKGIDLSAVVSGDIKNPKIKIDASKFLQSQALEKIEEKIEKKVKEKFKDKLKGKIDDDEDLNKLVQGLKSIFKK